MVPTGPGPLEPERPRRRWVIVAVALVLVAAVAVVVAAGAAKRSSAGADSGNGGTATALATVTRRSLSTQAQLTGTLEYAGSYAVLGQSHGLVTWLPTPGQVVGNGDVLYRVDGKPVVLLHGSVPAYRALGAGATAAAVTGVDVAQLNHDLARLGYLHSADVVGAWDEFDWATRAGVERLQEHFGVAPTGRLALGDVVFLPTAARVTTLQVGLGGPATGPILTATSTARTVQVALPADQQAEVRAGDRVTITLPGGGTTPGAVTSVGRVASIGPNTGGRPGGSDPGPTVPVTIRPADPGATGHLDQSPVVVAIADRTVRDVLAVPVFALLALAGGAYAVEIVSGDGTHHQVRVSPGLFDDAQGLVQVSGSGLAAGERVVVPSQ